MSSVFLVRTFFVFLFLLIISFLSTGPISWLDILLLTLASFVWSYLIGKLMSLIKVVYQFKE